MTTPTEALALARDALTRALSDDQAYIDKCEEAIAAIDALAQQPSAPSAEPHPTRGDLIAALTFYATGGHMNLSDESAWDTVSGEPQNWWCDEAGTATIEDGSLAKMALAGDMNAEHFAALERGDDVCIQPEADRAPTAPAPLPAALLVRDIANDLGIKPLIVCKALETLGYGSHSVNMAITADMAAALTKHFGAAPLTEPNRAFAITLLKAAAQSGDPGAINLAAQLAGTPACEGCGYVAQHCRCTAETAATASVAGLAECKTPKLCARQHECLNRYGTRACAAAPAAPVPTVQPLTQAEIDAIVNASREADEGPTQLLRRTESHRAAAWGLTLSAAAAAPTKE